MVRALKLTEQLSLNKESEYIRCYNSSLEHKSLAKSDLRRVPFREEYEQADEDFFAG